jgi:uncharacterized protein (TIGR02757 family)
MDRFEQTKSGLEGVFNKYHRPEYIHPDPLEFVLQYPDLRDREIVGLIASSLAMGNVRSILQAVKSVLDRLPSPHAAITGMTVPRLKELCSGFYFRFYKEANLAAFLTGIRGILAKYGSLQECFARGMRKNGMNMLSAQDFFVNELRSLADGSLSILLCAPCDGSACKRLNLFLRWMVRKDGIDPGGWSAAGPQDLFLPVDTHLLRAAQKLGFTYRKQADLKSVIEITEAFRKIDPLDPARFDFSLTRPGINRMDSGPFILDKSPLL